MAKSTAAIEIEVLPKGSADTTVKNFKQQLREAKIEAQQMVAQFGEFSNEALQAQQKVANLADQMDDFNDRVKALNPDKFARVQTVVNGIASGFSAAQGAMALFGSESEDLQKTLVKVQGAMALAQGLEGLGKVQQQFTTLAKDTLQAVIKAFSTLKGAIIATGIGALAVSLGLIVAYWDEIAEALSGVSAEQKKVNAATRDAVAAQQGNIEKLKSYQKLVTDTTLTEKERKNALDQLNKLGIETRDININSAKSLATLNARIQDNILLIQQKAKAQALEKIIAEETEKIYRVQNQTADESVSLLQEFIAQTQLRTKEGEAQIQKDKQIEKSQKLLNAATNEYDVLLKGLNKTETKVAETTTTVNDAYEKQNATLQNKLNLTLTALDKQKAKELSNLNLTERQKVEIENKYAELSLKTKEDAVKKEQKITGLITDPKQRLAQQRKLNEDLAKLEVDRINQRTSYNEKIQALNAKEIEQNKRNKEIYVQLQNEKFDEEAQKQIAFIKERDKYLTDRSKSEQQIAQIEIDALQKKYDLQKQLGIDDTKLAQEIADKKTAIREKELAEEKAKAEKEKEIQTAKYQAINDSLNAIADIYSAFATSSEEDQRKAFEVNKAAQIAQAIVNTYQGVTAALSAVPLFPGQQFINAGLVLASGIASVKKISDTKFDSKNVNNSPMGNRVGGGGVQQMAAPRASTLPTNEALTQERKVYVTEGDISRTQRRVSNNQSVSVVE